MRRPYLVQFLASIDQSISLCSRFPASLSSPSPATSLLLRLTPAVSGKQQQQYSTETTNTTKMPPLNPVSQVYWFLICPPFFLIRIQRASSSSVACFDLALVSFNMDSINWHTYAIRLRLNGWGLTGLPRQITIWCPWADELRSWCFSMRIPKGTWGLCWPCGPRR